MTSDRRAELVDLLRGRVLRGVAAGSLRRGDRLPSARELEGELQVDHRVVLDAYRELADEGLVELRPRGGIYVAAESGGLVPLPSATWIAGVLTQGIARELPATELHEWLRRAVETVRLRAVAIQQTDDQIAGLCRELRDDYGLEAVGVHADQLRAGAPVAALREADLVVTTGGLESLVRPVVEPLGARLVIAEIRPDLVGGEWRMLLKRPVYVVVREEAFVEALRQFFATTPGAENIRTLIVGRDDLEAIPDDAPVYVTRSAREALEGVRLRGRLLPTARLLSADASRAIMQFVVDANLAALAALRRSR